MDSGVCLIRNSAVQTREKLFALVLMMASGPAAAEFMAYTVENVGKPYTPVEGLCVYEEARGFSMKLDPIEPAIIGAFEQMKARAVEIGADALVAFDIDFANRTQKDEGRVVLCGTLVKFD
jgi:hypothetical protein